MLLTVALTLGYLVGVDDPSMSDSAILERLNDDARQVAAGIGMPVLAAEVALLIWFATGLRWLLHRLSGGDPLAYAIVPAAALFGGLMIVGVSLDVASGYAASSEEFTADADTVRALDTAGNVVALTGSSAAEYWSPRRRVSPNGRVPCRSGPFGRPTSLLGRA